jgi:hypothetical protein
MTISLALEAILIVAAIGRQQTDNAITSLADRRLKDAWRKSQHLADFEFMGWIGPGRITALVGRGRNTANSSGAAIEIDYFFFGGQRISPAAGLVQAADFFFDGGSVKTEAGAAAGFLAALGFLGSRPLFF